jgi:hypothetical protein
MPNLNPFYMRYFNDTQNTQLTSDQRRMLNNYINMYNNTLLEMKGLNAYLRELRRNIDYIYFQSNEFNLEQIRINRQYRNNTTPYIDIHRERRYNRTHTIVNEDFLDPIAIIPTITQITTATRLERFGNILNPVNVICPITQDPFVQDEIVTQIKYCSHLFNSISLNTWFLSKCICPICRYDIRQYRADNTLETPTTINRHLIQSQTEPITTSVSYIEPFRFRDISNNDDLRIQYAREYNNLLTTDVSNSFYP